MELGLVYRLAAGTRKASEGAQRVDPGCPQDGDQRGKAPLPIVDLAISWDFSNNSLQI